jgi:hypothetical protein
MKEAAKGRRGLWHARTIAEDEARRFTPGGLLVLRTVSLDLEVAGGFLASIRDYFVFDLLTLIEGA